MQFIWPLDDYIITRDFYYLASLYVGGQHAALDLIRRLAPTRASPVKAVADWTAVGVGWDMYSGFFVALDHANGFRSFYRHLYGQSPVVVGQQGVQGQIIGNIGNTGWSQGDHLHLDLWNRNKIRDDNAIFYKNDWYAVDPVKYLGKEEEDDMALQQIVEEHQKIIDNLWDRVAGLEQARDSFIAAIAELQKRPAGGGVSETRVKAIVKSAKHTV